MNICTWTEVYVTEINCREFFKLADILKATDLKRSNTGHDSQVAIYVNIIFEI